MKDVPRVVLLSLAVIAIPGVVFAITSLSSGAMLIALAFAVLPASALAVLRRLRASRAVLLTASIGALAPLGIGVVLTWPTVAEMLPYLAGISALLSGVAGMLSPAARRWYAAPSPA